MTAASALGSWPGNDNAALREAVHVVRDVLTDDSVTGRPGVPYLPEMPGRGPGADMIGRAAGLLVELPVDVQPSGWRFVDRPGRDVSRAQAFLNADLDELAEAYDGYVGPVKFQVCGPLTLAAQVRLHRGERAIVDPGACHDIAASLAEGLRGHLRDVRRLLPGVHPIIQLDEPSLPAALSGEFATSSGFGRIRAVDAGEVVALLGVVVAAARQHTRPEPSTDQEQDANGVIVHCCAPRPPIALLREAGVDAVSLDVGLLGPGGWESVAVAVEAGTQVWAGLLDVGGIGESPALVAAPLLRAWRELGLHADLLNQVVVTPTCGLAAASPAGAVQAHQDLMRVAAEVAAAAG
ncbi:hypothetical protein KEM60_02050 [Austwickia sp. TVS 96-490-7B]|uniref:methionine synthase n=1 Tax=Austwickia sp. TVS 96-490-7B TaxID=2830843 RepID=UPI001C5978E5|nr:methionine synthase [Austwickia sp. TVS 96-490-7B]MBW3085839.1 hypothetical protein [Austwickia sp. TVS 96-490-7B]